LSGCNLILPFDVAQHLQGTQASAIAVANEHLANADLRQSGLSTLDVAHSGVDELGELVAEIDNALLQRDRGLATASAFSLVRASITGPYSRRSGSGR